MMIMTPSSASPPLPNSPPANHHHIHGSHGSAVGSSHHRVPSPSTSAADRPPQPERMNAHPMDAVKGPSSSLTHHQQSQLQSRQQQQQSSSSSGRSHRERYGRRPSNYTASYTPPAALVQTAANARAAREADDEQERQERIRDNTAGSHGSSHGHGHGHGSRSRRSNQHSNSHSNSHSYSATSPPRTNNNSNSNPNHSSAHSHSSHSTKSNSKQELTEQQIAEYAGKRALMRLEQEFTAEQKALSPLSHQNHHCNNNNNNNKNNHALYNTKSTSSRSIVSNTSSMASSSSNTNTNNYQSHHKSKVISVMDRKKLARVPQVNKRDLAIGEYLGRGNFCDVFEVTWVLPGGDVNSSDNDYRDDGSHSQYSDDYDGHCKKMEALSLSCSNDLRPVFDLGQRRSISQINTSLQNRYQVRVTSSSTGRNNNSNTARVGREVYTIGTTVGGGEGAGDAMTMNATANTSSRSTLRNPNILALKCLRPAVRAQPRKFVIGAEDLAHETALLACLDHPNIIQLYGRAEGCFSTAFHFGTNTNTSPTNNNSNNSNSKEKAMYHEGYFIILDRLMATLTERIDEWQNECRTINGAAPITTNTTMPEETIRMNIAETTLREHLYKRLKVAYCIADALEYLHSRHVVFRDLKPANVGFDCNDCVKMFDFGFATSIAPLLNQPTQHDKGGYGPLTETCGTRRYMAPEVALKLGYGKEVDVYSFGMLLWEICALEKPFDSIKSVDAFHDMVVLCGKRPSLHIDPLWTTSLKNLMSRCWSTDPLDRPTMVQVKSMLCNVLRDMNVSEMESKMRSAGAVAGNGNSASSGIARGGAGEARGGGGRKGEGSQVPSQQQQQQQHPQGGPPMHFFNKMRRRVTM